MSTETVPSTRADAYKQFLQMGFPERDAELLAATREGNTGFYLWPMTVRRALAGGCSHEQALLIFA